MDQTQQNHINVVLNLICSYTNDHQKWRSIIRKHNSGKPFSMYERELLRKAFEEIEDLIEQGLNLNAPCKLSPKPGVTYFNHIHEFLFLHTPEFVAKLIADYGAIPNTKSLQIDIKKGRGLCCDLLIENGADPNCKFGGIPLIILAVKKGNIKALETLLIGGADVNVLNESVLIDSVIGSPVRMTYYEYLKVHNRLTYQPYLSLIDQFMGGASTKAADVAAADMDAAIDSDVDMQQQQ